MVSIITSHNSLGWLVGHSLDCLNGPLFQQDTKVSLASKSGCWTSYTGLRGHGVLVPKRAKEGFQPGWYQNLVLQQNSLVWVYLPVILGGLPSKCWKVLLSVIATAHNPYNQDKVLHKLRRLFVPQGITTYHGSDYNPSSLTVTVAGGLCLCQSTLIVCW